MKHISIFILAAAMGLMLASCNKQAGESRFITVSAGIGVMTKVDYDGDEARFESGDKISVYAWTGNASEVVTPLVVDGVVNTFDGTQWTPEIQMLWDNKSSKHFFLGISPERKVTDFTADVYTLDPASFASSDLMIATNLKGLPPTDNPVALNFSHVLARLDVNLTFRSQWADAPTVTSVTATGLKTATVNYLDKEMTPTGTAEAIALLPSANDAWTGLQVPQDGVRTITIAIDGKNYVFTNSEDIPLVSGKFTTVNLAVGRDKIDLVNDITISNWTSQGGAVEGDAEEE